MENRTNFRRLGTMLDCSRNAVMNVNSIKRWVDITSDLGYNTLMLYTEDTYEVDENPYFGYKRGRYTQEELREINDYAISRGMELIPCIQTLAHLNAIVRWPVYKEHIDVNDILLAGDDVVYELIDKMFASLSKCFTSRIINIGMDEAHMIGRGKYYDLHGDTDRFQILLNHIKRVCKIGEKYGFRFVMWSDMFFRLAAGGRYYDGSVEINKEISKSIPDNIELIYWDYYSTDKNRYDTMLSAHEKIKTGTWFAGGLWTWAGMAPHNNYSIKATEAALAGCIKNGIKDVFFTMWGDNGGECSKFSLLPALYYASEIARGNTDDAVIKAGFEEKFGISFDDFMLLDLPGTAGVSEEKICNADKYLLYNDCFTGLMDSTLSGGENEQYRICKEKLLPMKQNVEWGYLFDTMHALCDVLSQKAELSAITRKVYESKDREALKNLIEDYTGLHKKVKNLYSVYKKQWFLENKPHGFDVQDIRFGGLMNRILSCQERLQELYDGKIKVIEELEEECLDFLGSGKEISQEHCFFKQWDKIVTTNLV